MDGGEGALDIFFGFSGHALVDCDDLTHVGGVDGIHVSTRKIEMSIKDWRFHVTQSEQS